MNALYELMGIFLPVLLLALGFAGVRRRDWRTSLCRGVYWNLAFILLLIYPCYFFDDTLYWLVDAPVIETALYLYAGIPEYSLFWIMGLLIVYVMALPPRQPVCMRMRMKLICVGIICLHYMFVSPELASHFSLVLEDWPVLEMTEPHVTGDGVEN